jgi:hypothetical protein
MTAGAPLMPTTIADFRKIALALPQAVEASHMGHPDFRVDGKIFATLDAPEKGWAMVKLTPEEQEVFMRAEPEMFAPAAGAWGRRGSTLVRLKAADKPTLKSALPHRRMAGHRTQAAGCTIEGVGRDSHPPPHRRPREGGDP